VKYTGHTQKNGAISKIDEQFISHPHGHNIRCQQRELFKFIIRYKQFGSNAWCGASFQDGVAAGEGFLCAPF
jgi:hypothetical protein